MWVPFFTVKNHYTSALSSLALAFFFLSCSHESMVELSLSYLSLILFISAFSHASASDSRLEALGFGGARLIGGNTAGAGDEVSGFFIVLGSTWVFLSTKEGGFFMEGKGFGGDWVSGFGGLISLSWSAKVGRLCKVGSRLGGVGSECALFSGFPLTSPAP